MPPALDLALVAHETQRTFVAVLVVLAAALGLQAAYRREPFGARLTTLVYGAVTLGVGLFAAERPLALLLAYVVGLLGMNALLYHAWTYGPVLAGFREEDDASRRARAVTLRSLGVSAALLVASYLLSLALLPLFAMDLVLTDPLSALAIAASLLVLLLLLSLSGEARDAGTLPSRSRRRRET